MHGENNPNLVNGLRYVTYTGCGPLRNISDVDTSASVTDNSPETLKNYWIINPHRRIDEVGAQHALTSHDGSLWHPIQHIEFKSGTAAKEMDVKRSIKIVGIMAAAGIAFAGFGASKAKAATATANLGVTATVTNNCTISTVALAFGSYDPVVANASTNLDGTGTVIVACTKGATATIGLGLGSNASGSVRRMGDGSSNFLTYELYNESTRTTVWSEAGGGLVSTGAAPSKAARNFTVYGRVTSNQDVPAGSYADTVVATVNF